MKAADLHRMWRALPLAEPLEVIRCGPVLVLSPHPDDETLGLGGLVAASREAAIPVHVVVISDGSQSHPRSRAYPSHKLIELRRTEVEAAGDVLGLDPKNLTFLDLPDTAVPFEGSAFDQAVDTMVGTMQVARIRSVFVTWGGDPHCDHEAATAMAQELRRRLPELQYWSYPIWGWHLEGSQGVASFCPNGFRLDIEPWLDRKRAAIKKHVSQMTDLINDDPGGFRFTPETLAPFLEPFEVIFEMPS